MAPLRIGLLGTGGIANEFLAPALGLAGNACLWSVLSRSMDNARAFADRHGARSPTPAYDSLDAMLKDPELDAVLVATPDRMHATQTIAAARAKKHVLCEKPLATTVEQARAMLSACEAHGVTLGVAYHLRHHAGHKAFVRELHQGAIGRVRHARVQWTFAAQDASGWRARGDVGRWWALAAVGTHAIDMVRWIMAPSAGDVTALRCLDSSPKFATERDESTMVSMRFEDGSTAEVFASVLFRAPRRIEVFGDDGYAHAEGTLGPRGAGDLWINERKLEYVPENPYVGEIHDFADAVRAGRSPAVDGPEGMRNVELLCLALP
jgi:predicted dehydrogenase